MLEDIFHMEIIYIRCGYTDMRKQLNRLLDIIQYSFRLDPYSNFLFLFCGKRTDQIKAVHYEWDGFCLLYKRYENRHLQWLQTDVEAKQISEQQLRWPLEGLNPEQPKAVQKWLPHKSKKLLKSLKHWETWPFYGMIKVSKQNDFQPMQNIEQEYKDHIKKLEQRIRLLKKQVDFLTWKLYGTKCEQTSTLEIEGQMSLFDEINPALIPIHPNQILSRWKNISVKGSMPVSGRN